MKKAVLIFTLLALVVLLNACAGFFVSRYAPDYAYSTASDLTAASQEVQRASKNVTLGDLEKCNPHGCHDECKKLYGSAGGGVKYTVGCGCECYTQSYEAEFVNVGTAGTTEECCKMAAEAGYVRSYWNESTGNCGGYGQYEELGTAETAKECSEMAKAAGRKNTVWDSDSKKCGVSSKKVR
ncbi:MAG: hypothetical protein FWB85_09915 [Chitinispirillia bacterium]|nr:hypothetical protein [Chitinispirillia bacterium]